MQEQGFVTDWPRLHAAWIWVTSHAYFMSGVFGGLTASVLVRDTWPRRLALLVLTPFPVVFVAPVAHDWALSGVELNGSREAAGYIVGLFSIVILRIVFAGLERVHVGGVLQALVDWATSIVDKRSGPRARRKTGGRNDPKR